jgi:hypothetical protein
MPTKFAATAIDNVDDILVDSGPSLCSPFGTPALDSGPLEGRWSLGAWSLGGRWLAREARSRDLL